MSRRMRAAIDAVLFVVAIVAVTTFCVSPSDAQAVVGQSIKVDIAQGPPATIQKMRDEYRRPKFISFPKDNPYTAAKAARAGEAGRGFAVVASEVRRALTQMAEVTQQNSALVEENAATAKTLEHQAMAMDEQVAFFKVDDGADSAAPEKKEEQRPVYVAPSRGPAAKLNNALRAA